MDGQVILSSSCCRLSCQSSSATTRIDGFRPQSQSAVGFARSSSLLGSPTVRQLLFASSLAFCQRVALRGFDLTSLSWQLVASALEPTQHCSALAGSELQSALLCTCRQRAASNTALHLQAESKDCRRFVNCRQTSHSIIRFASNSAIVVLHC